MEWLGVERRRLGTALLVFGLVGMVLAAVIAAGLIAGGFAARNLDDRISADQVRLSAALHRMTTSIDTLATSTAHAGATLNTTSALIDQARLVIADVASTSDELANNLGFSVLGQQPLAGAAGKFRDLSAQLKTFGGMTGGLSDNLSTNADDLTGLTSEIQQIGVLTQDLAARVDSFDQAGEIVSLMVGGIILGGLLVLWLAIAAGFCAWAGWRLRKVAAAEAAGVAPGGPA
jgi:outer membrane murein-binding lipoprotein Lpp